MKKFTPPFFPDYIYHIYNRANGNELLFRSEDNYNFFLNKFALHLTPILDTFAYCLLPNHFHFLVRIKAESLVLAFFEKKYSRKSALEIKKTLEQLLSKQFANFLNSYAKAFNKMYQRSGNLFNQNLKRKIVEKNDYLLRAIRYIHANPVHHGLTERMDTWRYCSFQTYLFDKPTKLAAKEVLDIFGGRKHFLEFHRMPVDSAEDGELEFE